MSIEVGKTYRLDSGVQVSFADKPAKPEAARGFKMMALSGMAFSYMGCRVIIDAKGLKAAAQKMPILRDHDPSKIAGFSTSVDIDEDDGEVEIDGQMTASTADGREIAQLADEGFPWQASVGMMKVESIERLEADAELTVNGKAFKGPGLVVRAATLRESSFVPLGADAATRSVVLTAMGDEKKEIENMSATATPTGTPAPIKIDSLSIAEFKNSAPSLYALVREDVLREEGARRIELEKKIQATGLPAEAQRDLLLRCQVAKPEEIATIIERRESVEVALAAGERQLVERIGADEAKKEMATLAKDIGDLPKFSAVKIIQSHVDLRLGQNKKAIVTESGTLQLSNSEKDKRLEEVKKIVTDVRAEFKAAKVSGLNEKDWLLSEVVASGKATEDELKSVVPDLFK